MDNNQIIILVDAIAYLLTFVYWLIKLKRLNVGLILLGIMTISHVGSVIYYDIMKELGLLEADIKLLPFVYLYVLIMLCLLPFLRFNGVKYIDVKGGESLIRFFTFFLIIINLEPFVENLNLLRSSGSDYSELYEDLHDENLKLYTGIGSKLMGWLNHFRIFIPLLFFYQLTKPQINWVKVIGLGMCLVNLVLFWINMGARGGIVSQFFMYVIAFVLIDTAIPEKRVSRIKKILLLASIPGILLFGAITVSRYESKSTQDKTLFAWLLLYTSEGPIKFNTEMWDGPHNTNGDVNTNFIKDVLGMKTYKTFNDRDDYYLAKNGRRIEVFYTYIGDFLSDFSYMGGIIICLFLFLIEKKFMKTGEGMPFHYFLFLIFIAHLYSIGFASNMYRDYTLQKGLFYMFVIFCLFDMSRNSIKTKIVQ